MNRPTKDELLELYRVESDPLISIFLPTHRAGRETQQDPIRLKNLLREAASQLEAAGVESEDAETKLAEGWKLVDDYQFWQHQEDGLALYLGPETSRMFKVPRTLPELVVVGDRFHVTPLLELLPGDETFHVLAVSPERVRLLVGDRYRIEELDPEEIPESLRDVVGYDYEQRSLQFRSGVEGGSVGGRSAAMFHGHGAGDDQSDEELQQFLLRVDGGLCKLLDAPRPPLVLASVDRVAAAYKDLTDHGSVVADFVEGNADELSPEELHERAWPLARAELSKPRDEAWERLQSLLHTDQGSDDLEDIVIAAADGRVDTLFVADGEHRWGTYDLEQRSVEMADSPQDAAGDLIARAAMDAVTNSGTLYVLPADDLGSSAPIAAIYRY